jgi:hypothetical protein
MADNVVLNPGAAGSTIATDDIGGIQYQRVKATWGPDGTATDVDTGASALPIKDGGNSITVDGTVGVSGTVTVDGSGVTQPVSGTVAVTGTVTANAGTNLNTSLLALESGGNLATIASLARAEDSAHSSGHSGVMALAVRESTATDLSVNNANGDYEPLQVDANGALWTHETSTVTVAVSSNPSTSASGSIANNADAVTSTTPQGYSTVSISLLGTWVGTISFQYSIDGSNYNAYPFHNGTGAVTSSTANGVFVATSTAAARMRVTATAWTSGTATVAINFDSASSSVLNYPLPTGANAIGKLAANTGITIGAVEIAAAQTLAALTGSSIAHASADSGNPHKIGMRAKSSLTAITLASADNRSDLFCDIDGVAIYKNGAPSGNLQSERISNTDGASTAFSTFGAAANLRNFITAVTIHNSHSTTNGYVDLRDGTGGSIIWTFPAPATGGVTHNFDPPLRQPTANTALAYDVSAAISTIYISINGYQSKA